MGSFAYTCGVSHLPIHCGDTIRYILLSSSPYEGESCGASQNWFPRSFPIRAEYNDYGSIQNDEAGVGRELWREALKIDLVSVGVGENTCHDVATSKEMSWKAFLNALQEHRVKVRHDIGNEPETNRETNREMDKALGRKHVTPKGVPTMQRLKKALRAAGYKISSGNMSPGYMVSKVRYGTIRLRWAGLAKDWEKDIERLTEILPLLSEYAMVLKAGDTGAVSDTELLVCVKPGNARFRERRRYNTKPLKVDHLMVREDVWQALLTMPVEADYGRKVLTIDDHRKAVRELYAKACETYHKAALDFPEGTSPEMVSLIKSARRMLGYTLESLGHNNPVGFMAHDEIPFAVGFGTNWRLLVEKNLPEAEVSHVLDGIAELAHVIKVLYPVRFAWAPSTSVGPQFGLWAAHAVVNMLFGTLAADIDAKEMAEQEEEEREYEARKATKPSD